MSQSAATPSKQGFFIRRSNIKGRLDAEFNYARLTIRITSQYPQIALRKISRSRTGGTPNKAIADYWNGDIPWASPKDFGHFYLEDTEDHITQAAVIDSSTTVVPKGSVLLVFRSGILQHTMPVAVTKREMAINQDVKAFTFDHSIMPEYAAAYFTIFGSRLLPLITKSGATVQSINTEQFEQLAIPIPPLDVQKQIVDELLLAFQTKHLKELEAISLLQTIDEVMLAELGVNLQVESPNTVGNRIFYRKLSEVSGERIDPAFHHPKYVSLESSLKDSPWPKERLGNLISDIVGGATPDKSDGTLYAQEGVKFLRILNIGANEFDLTDLNYISDEVHNGYLRRSQLKKNDVLMTITGRVGNAAVVTADILPANINQHIVRLRVENSPIQPEYLAAYLNSSIGLKMTLRGVTGGTRIALDYGAIRAIQIPVPNPEIQITISSKVSSIRKEAKDLRERALQEFEAVKRHLENLVLAEGNQL